MQRRMKSRGWFDIRVCDCGSRMNAGIHGHAEGCANNWPDVPPVSNKVKWPVALIGFYGGLWMNVGSESLSLGWWAGATGWAVAIGVLATIK